MNLATMRTTFKAHTSGLADSLSDVEVDAYLNRAYRYVIPADLGGEYQETLWQLATTIGQATYDLPANIVAVNQGAAWIDSYDSGAGTISVGLRMLDWETDYTAYYFWDRLASSSNGRPDTILAYGRQVILNPAPDLAYTVQIPARGGPTADLGVTGIENDLHALAVVTAAAWEYLGESEDHEGMNREGGLYEKYKGLLQTYAQGRPEERFPARSF